MSDSSLFLKIVNYSLFIILSGLGVLFILASPADASVAGLRLITGNVLIFIAILMLVVISLVIQRREYKIVKVIKKGKESFEQPEHVPQEIICKNCGNPIELTDYLKKKREVICEKCGAENIIPKDNVNW